MTIEPIINPPETLLSDTDSLDENILFTDCNLVNIMNYKNKTYLVYDEEEEIKTEIKDYESHINKNNDSWITAKNIISSSLKQNNSHTFFWDYLDIQFKNNNDDFNNIKKVVYSTNTVILEFENTIAKYIVDNLKINKFKPSGYIFSSTDNTIWDFKIVVITTNNIYSSNRYIDENTIGFY